jgi:hypothetical protein
LEEKKSLKPWDGGVYKTSHSSPMWLWKGHNQVLLAYYSSPLMNINFDKNYLPFVSFNMILSYWAIFPGQLINGILITIYSNHVRTARLKDTVATAKSCHRWLSCPQPHPYLVPFGQCRSMTRDLPVCVSLAPCMRAAVAMVVPSFIRASGVDVGLRAPTKEKEAATAACKLRPLAAPASPLVGCPGVPHFQIWVNVID